MGISYLLEFGSLKSQFMSWISHAMVKLLRGQNPDKWAGFVMV
jgi:hypothetical protein